VGKKAGGSEPPENSVPKAHAPLLRSKAHLTHRSYLVPWLLQENFLLPRRFPSESRK